MELTVKTQKTLKKANTLITLPSSHEINVYICEENIIANNVR